MPHCAAFAGPSGPAFSFSAYLRFLSTISLRVGATLVFTCLDFAGVVPLSVFNTAHSASQGKFLFCVQNEVTPPPKGGGAGYHLTWLAGILMRRSPVLFRRKRRILRTRGLLSAVALATAGHNRLTRLQRGLSGASLVSFPYPALKTGHRATQGRVWVHHFFLERFCPGRTAKSRSSL